MNIRPSRALIAACLAAALSVPADAATLLGRAVLDAETFAPGPTSGQFITPGAGTARLPYVDKQPVQGFSAVLPGPRRGTYLFMVDNGFGAKANSADSMLRAYAVEPDFETGKVHAVDIHTGARRSDFSDSVFELADPDHHIAFPIVADQETYPNGDRSIPVAPAVKARRLLTGADFDLESFRRAPDGTYWFGEEFGPYLLHTDAGGRVLEPPFPTPNLLRLGANPYVESPSNPAPHDGGSNLPDSKGFEGMALTAGGTKLYALLEGPLNADPDRQRLLIHEFDIGPEQFTGRVFQYHLEQPYPTPGYAIGDMTAINNHEFLVIERDNNQGDPRNPAVTTPARFKKIFKIDISKTDAAGFVDKVEVADLMRIEDPWRLGGNGTIDGVFNFPFVTIESVLVLDADTLLVANDNNYPFSTGRTPAVADNNEIILLHLNTRLDVRRGALPPVRRHGTAIEK